MLDLLKTARGKSSKIVIFTFPGLGFKNQSEAYELVTMSLFLYYYFS